jgi:hypothetical protein
MGWGCEKEEEKQITKLGCEKYFCCRSDDDILSTAGDALLRYLT